MIWATIFTETIFTEEMGEGFYHLCLLQLRLRTSKILKHQDSKHMYFKAKTLSVCLNTVLDQDLSTLLCTQFSSARARQTPPPSEHSHKIPVYNVSPDRTTAVSSLIQY